MGVRVKGPAGMGGGGGGLAEALCLFTRSQIIDYLPPQLALGYA